MLYVVVPTGLWQFTFSLGQPGYMYLSRWNAMYDRLGEGSPEWD